MRKVRDIRIIGLPVFVPVVNKHYTKIKRDIHTGYGIEIPSKVDMELDKNVLWYVSVACFSVHVVYDSFEYKFSFSQGFMTDNGSIPHFLQSIITNNNPMALIGFFCHDLLYQTKHFGENKKAWRKSNQIMKDILSWYGLNPVTNQLIKSAVDTPVGWSNYKKRFKRDTTPKGGVKFINYKSEASA